METVSSALLTRTQGSLLGFMRYPSKSYGKEQEEIESSILNHDIMQTSRVGRFACAPFSGSGGDSLEQAMRLFARTQSRGQRQASCGIITEADFTVWPYRAAA